MEKKNGVSDDQVARVVVEARKLEIAEKRREMGLATAHGFFRLVGAARLPYPAAPLFCSAWNTAIPEALRCHGNHPRVAGEVYRGEIIEVFPGHRLPGPEFAEVPVDVAGNEVSLEDRVRDAEILVPVEAAANEVRVVSAKVAALETKRAELDAAIALERSKVEACAEALDLAKAKLEACRASRSAAWRAALDAGRKAAPPPPVSDEPESEEAKLNREYRAGKMTQSELVRLREKIVEQGLSLDEAKKADARVHGHIEDWPHQQLDERSPIF